MHQVQLRIQVDCDGDGELSVREWGRYLTQEEKRFGVEITGPMNWDTVSPQKEGFDDVSYFFYHLMNMYLMRLVCMVACSPFHDI
jgi:hypothetical protein